MDRPIGSSENARTAREVVLVDPVTGAPGVGQTGIYNASLPNLASGQRAEIQVNSKGEQIIAVDQMIVGDGQSSTLCAIHDRAGASRPLATAGYVFNGTGYDRHRKPSSTARMTSSAASTNAAMLKSAPGDLWKVVGHNASASIIYLKFYNKAASPSVGSDVPTLSLPLKPSSSFDFDLAGHYFSVGIAFALTLGSSDSDTSAIAAGDIVALNVTFA